MVYRVESAGKAKKGGTHKAREESRGKIQVGTGRTKKDHLPSLNSSGPVRGLMDEMDILCSFVLPFPNEEP